MGPHEVNFAWFQPMMFKPERIEQQPNQRTRFSEPKSKIDSNSKMAYLWHAIALRMFYLNAPLFNETSLNNIKVIPDCETGCMFLCLSFMGVSLSRWILRNENMTSILCEKQYGRSIRKKLKLRFCFSFLLVFVFFSILSFLDRRYPASHMCFHSPGEKPQFTTKSFN